MYWDLSDPSDAGESGPMVRSFIAVHPAPSYVVVVFFITIPFSTASVMYSARSSHVSSFFWVTLSRRSWIRCTLLSCLRCSSRVALIPVFLNLWASCCRISSDSCRPTRVSLASSCRISSVSSELVSSKICSVLGVVSRGDEMTVQFSMGSFSPLLIVLSCQVTLFLDRQSRDMWPFLPHA